MSSKEKGKSGKRLLHGEVVSTKMMKTVKVRVTRVFRHPLYHKLIKVSKDYLADTGGREVENGDKVEIQECRPLSKRKRWKLIRILKPAQG